MATEIIISGFGGQGIMLIGQLIAYAGMLDKKYVSWIPSYGPEMRGGTANCSVIVSDKIIGAPIVSEPQILIAMNNPSLDKFEALVRPGGIVILNSSLIERSSIRSDITTIGIRANDMANKLGNSKVANMIVLGAFLGVTKVVSSTSVLKTIHKVFNAKPELIHVNQIALEYGQSAICTV
ncbi:hypothetical protein SDC9_154491 [bioreactor metagenome]|uniref:Pyruvate/ketoisovalerate oxidoreductase catalytic domain-containing protein n=1 Tax=bioreactor metagenome TaxID=1076179 RepID=A0A645EYU3_9ZZZZ